MADATIVVDRAGCSHSRQRQRVALLDHELTQPSRSRTDEEEGARSRCPAVRCGGAPELLMRKHDHNLAGSMKSRNVTARRARGATSARADGMSGQLYFDLEPRGRCLSAKRKATSA